jgi:tetratricopeptide (TPR) repeat protein
MRAMGGVRAGAAAALSVAISMLVSACGDASARAQRHLERGREHFDAGHAEKARVEFGNAAQIAPHNPEPRFLSGLAAERLGNVRDAVRHYQAAADLDPTHVPSRVHLARVFVFAGAPSQALEVVASIPPGVRHRADVLVVRAAAHHRLGEHGAADEALSQALELDPASDDAIALAAGMKRDRGDVDGAVTLVRGVLDSRPESLELRQVLTDLLVGRGDFAAAEAELRRIIAARSADPVARRRLADLLVRAGDAGRAIDETARAALDFPDSLALKLSHAELVREHRSADEALDVLEQYARQGPYRNELRFAHAELLERSGHLERARQAFADLRGIEGPIGDGARLRLAALYAAGGNIADASALVAEVLREHPRDTDALLLRAQLALEQGHAADAIPDLRAVLRERPDAVQAAIMLSRAHLGSGEMLLAESVLRDAARNSPGHTRVVRELADLLLGRGRAREAMAVLGAVGSEKSADPGLVERLARAALAAGDLAAAEQAVARHAAVAPGSSIGLVLRGALAEARSRAPDAEGAYRDALAIDPASREALTGLVRVLVSERRGAEALRSLDAAATAQANDVLTRTLRGEVLLSLGRTDAALREFEAVAKQAPRWPTGHRNLALARLATGDQEGALRAYGDALDGGAIDEQLVAGYASLLERRSEPDRAIAAYETLLTRWPKSDVAANNLAMLLVTYRQDASSIARAVELSTRFADSDDPALLDTYGWVRLKAGDPATALPALERAARGAPASAVVRYHLAMAQLEGGRRDEARSNLESALGQSDRFQGADEARIALVAIMEPAKR